MVEQGVPELEDARNGIEFETEERGPNVAGMFVFPPLESRGKDSNGGSDSARALEIACAKELLSGRETSWLGGGAGVEPLWELKDAVTGEDMLFVVCVLKEHDDTHALKYWKKRIREKARCRTAAQNHAEKDEKMLNEPLHKHSTKNS